MASDETAPGAEGTRTSAEGTRAGGGFRLGDSEYNTPETLGEALAQNWTAGTRHLARGDLQRWARDDLRDEQLAAAIAELESGPRETLDARYHGVIVRLNPGAARTYMGYPMTEEGLGTMAAEVEGDTPTQVAADALRSLYHGHALTAYAEATGQDNLREVDDRWHEEFEDWRRLTQAAKKAGGPDVFGPMAWRARGVVLRALVEREAMAALQERAKRASSGPAKGRAWFPDGDADEEGPGRLLAKALLAESPGLRIDIEDEEHEATASRNKTIRWAVAGTIFVAAVVGIVLLALGGASEEGPSASGSATASADGSGAPTVGPSRVIYTGAVIEPADLLAEPDPGAEVVAALEELAIVEVVAQTEADYYQVRLKAEPEVIGFMEKANFRQLCQGVCSVG